MTNFVTRLQKVAQNPMAFKEFGRGVERETLRCSDDGRIATTDHPQELGSAFTHKWITTDFAESLLEFITPVSQDISTLLSQLSDIHHFAQTQIGEENMWPLSMPCYIEHSDDIKLAQYGSSNKGQFKTLYRQGLKHRYGSLMQSISGVHFNFSFPDSFWEQLFGQQSEIERTDSKSEAYLSLIRNYYRFGWLIPFFFGASPAICPSFLQGRESKLPFEKIKHTLYLPYATSLRLSDLGYTNSAQSALKIDFNSLPKYLDSVNQAIRTPSEAFAKIGVNVDGEHRQLNSNILQIENELYARIRPKRVPQSGERPSQALARGGIEYIEVRSLDVNPFSPVGINEMQVRFLDLFLTWCVLSDSDPVAQCEQQCWNENWSKVITEGRLLGLKLQIGCHGEVLSSQEWAKRIFSDLELIAKEMDAAYGFNATQTNSYQYACQTLATWIDAPELTFSAQVLEKTKEYGGLIDMGNAFAHQHRMQHLSHQYQFYSTAAMQQEVERSHQAQTQIEQADQINFEQYLDDYFTYLK